MSEPVHVKTVVDAVLERTKTLYYKRMFEYLDDLRESGVTNMFGAGPYLEKQFGLPKKEAREVLGLWMRTFSERHKC